MNIIKKILVRIPMVKKILSWRRSICLIEKQKSIHLGSVGQKNEAFRLDWTKKQLTSLPNGLRILDAGAGERQFKPYCRHLNYVSQDFAQYDGKGDSSGLQLSTWDNAGLDIVSDIIAIPAPAQSFEAILCTEVIEHIPNAVLAIKEFSRLLKTGGTLIITAPFCSLTHFAPYHFSTGFNRYFYEHTLSEHGFEITEITPNGNYFEYLAQEIHRISSVASDYASDNLSEGELLAQKTLLNALNRFSEKDSKSSELLCFGYMVVAKKI